MPRMVYTDTQTFTTTAYNLAAGDELIMTDSSRMIGDFSDTLSSLILADDALVQNDGYAFTNSNGIEIVNGSTLVNRGTLEAHGTTGVFAVFVSGYDSGNSIFNSGVISVRDQSGNGAAIASYSSFALSNTGTVTSYGVGNNVIGTAIYSIAQASILNTGTISGFVSLGAASDTIYNTGTMTGNVFLGSGDNSVVNHAIINGVILALSGTDAVINDGTITGAVHLGGGDDRVINDHGTIEGSVNLASGNDTLSNVGGLIKGDIIGGLGDDTITGGDGRDVIYGDSVSGDTSGGADVLSGGYGDDLINAGYGNDTVYGNQGDDVLYGNQGSDWIHGGQGNDTIYGGKGGDTVNGGVGNDMLFGNLGDDLFVFARGFGHDTIGDFSVTNGNSDVINFGAGTFTSYADVQSHMVQQGGDVIIALNSADTIVVQHVDVSMLTADHFLFG